MINNTLQKSNTLEKYFYLFLTIHIVVWSLVPALVRLNLPLDAMEGTTWGHQLEWGYDKNPFVNAWLTALAVKIDGMSGLVTYFFSQLSVGAAFWVVWQLGKKILSPAYALFAVLLLESVQYFNLHAIDFNDNTLEMSFWALTIYYFYQALQHSPWRNWLLTGIFAGISMMTKYYAVMLLIPMLVFLAACPVNRLQFKKAPLYAGIATMAAICIPHTVWLFSHDFVTIQYAIGRVSSKPTAWNHLYFPIQFAWQQIETFLPVVFLSFLIVKWKKLFCFHGLRYPEKQTSNPLDNAQTISNFDLWFLIIIGLGPFVLTVLLSAVTGIKLRAAWGQPLPILWSLLFVVAIKHLIVVKRIFIFFITTLVIMGLMAGGYTIALIGAKEPSSANFPGKIIATKLTNEWRQKYHTPLRFVAGSRWLAGNIAFYSPDQPATYIDWDKQYSPWINEDTLKKEGALFIWDLSENALIPIEDIQKRFPNLKEIKVLHFRWLRNLQMEPVKIRVGYLPPDRSTGKEK